MPGIGKSEKKGGRDEGEKREEERRAKGNTKCSLAYHVEEEVRVYAKVPVQVDGQVQLSNLFGYPGGKSGDVDSSTASDTGTEAEKGVSHGETTDN